LARCGLFDSSEMQIERNHIFSIFPQALKIFYSCLAEAGTGTLPTKTVFALRSLIWKAVNAAFLLLASAAVDSISFCSEAGYSSTSILSSATGATTFLLSSFFAFDADLFS